MATRDDIIDPLLRQWTLIAAAIPSLDLEAPSRLRGWRNREVLAHLTLQPRLLLHFLAARVTDTPALDAPATHTMTLTLEDNLSGTAALAAVIDEVAKRDATAGRLDLAAGVLAAAPVLAIQDLTATITTVQGPILCRDYLITRCVEAVVHGRDLIEPVTPDGAALAIAASALMRLLAQKRSDLVPRASDLAPLDWVDIATGRIEPPPALHGVMPLMA